MGPRLLLAPRAEPQATRATGQQAVARPANATAAVGGGTPVRTELAHETAAAAPVLWSALPVHVDPAAQTLPRLPATPKPNAYPTIVQVPANVRTADSISFEVGGRTWRLAGLKPIEPWALCSRKNGSRWACGLRARMALRTLIGGRILQCAQPLEKPPAAAAVDCMLGDQRIATRVVASGWAFPDATAQPDIQAALDKAKADKAGFWDGVEPVVR